MTVNDEQEQRLRIYINELEKKASDRGVVIIYLVTLIVIVWTALW
jgi:hypothetical protein